MDNLSIKFLKLHKKTVYKDYSMFSENGKKPKLIKKWDGIEIKINELSDNTLQKWFFLFQEYLSKQTELKDLNIPNYYYSNFFVGFRYIILESSTLVDYAQKINSSRFTIDLKENIISNIVNNFSNAYLPEINSLKDEEIHGNKKVFIGIPSKDLYDKTKENINQIIKSKRLIPSFFTIQEDTIIDNKIYEEINSCDFGIFDISIDNSNMTYVAGYMLAKNKEVILVCNETLFNNLKFNFTNKNIVLFLDQEELTEKLSKKIDYIVTKS